MSTFFHLEKAERIHARGKAWLIGRCWIMAVPVSLLIALLNYVVLPAIFSRPPVYSLPTTLLLCLLVLAPVLGVVWGLAIWRVLRDGIRLTSRLHDAQDASPEEARREWKGWYTKSVGILGFGVPMAALVIFDDLFFPRNRIPGVDSLGADIALALISALITILLTLAAGYVWGLWMWYWTGERRVDSGGEAV